MDSPGLSTELRNLLVHGREVSDTLLERLDAAFDPVEVVGLLEALALVDERRTRVLEQFRKEASSMRRREEERSIRQFVLRALDQIGVPQTTGFLEDYLYASELVEAKSRGMGALRRDEYRAWHRLRDRPRVAYIVPCLDEAGRPVARWLARSDWPLRDRIVVEGAEDLWALQRAPALLRAHREAGPDADALFLPLVARYAGEALGEETTDADHDAGAEGLDRLSGAVNDRITSLEQSVRPAQERAATQLADRTEEQLLWGVPGPAGGASRVGGGSAL